MGHVKARTLHPNVWMTNAQGKSCSINQYWSLVTVDVAATTPTDFGVDHLDLASHVAYNDTREVELAVSWTLQVYQFNTNEL